jgi:hypothetical protein
MTDPLAAWRGNPFFVRPEGSNHVVVPSSSSVNSDQRIPPISSRRAPVSKRSRAIRS